MATLTSKGTKVTIPLIKLQWWSFFKFLQSVKVTPVYGSLILKCIYSFFFSLLKMGKVLNKPYCVAVVILNLKLDVKVVVPDLWEILFLIVKEM